MLRKSDLPVLGMVSIFNYGFDAARLAFEAAGVPFTSLTDYPALLAQARKQGLVQGKHEEFLLKWRQDPANWKGVD